MTHQGTTTADRRVSPENEMPDAAGARHDALTACFDILTAYLLDHCPDGGAWEDFDSVVDTLRGAIDDADITTAAP